MQALLSTGLSLALGFAPATTDPRAITPEAAEPALSQPESWSAPVDAPAPKVEPAAPASGPDAQAAGDHLDRDALDAPTIDRKPAPRSCFRTRGQCRQLTVAGIAFGSLGLAAIVTGIALSQIPNEPIADEPAYELSYRPPAVVAIGMGTGVLVTGILMIIAGQRAFALKLDGAQAKRPVQGHRRWLRR